jgi:hypothetical protein
MVALLAMLAGCGFEHGRLDDPTIGSTADGGTDGATAIDTPAPVTCPSSYTMTLPSTTTKYRVIATPAAFASHHAACNQDQSGGTHLASFETATEAMEMRDAILAMSSPPGTQFYVGAVQKPSQTTTTTGWYVFTGGPLDPSLWVSTPNDDNAGENNEENLGALNTGDLMHDVTGDLAYPAICECDGLTIDATVASYIP